LLGSASERGQVVLGADRATLERWMAGREAVAPMFGEPAVFRRQDP
jgi:hypothetical protein